MRIVLISCSKTKASGKRAAEEMYQGALFKKSLEYAKAVLIPDRIYILSAKYGLLPLDRQIENYDTTLIGQKATFVRNWASLVKQQIIMAGLDLFNDEFVLMAGETYCRYLIDNTQDYYIVNYTRPLQGLRLGEQIKRINQMIMNK